MCLTSSDSALYTISRRPTSLAWWWWCTPYINLSAITIEIYNCHLQKIRQLSRNGICCMIALFLISISACDSLEIIDSHAFCNEIVRLFLSSMGAAIFNHFPLSRESDWKRFYESTPRPRVTKIMRSRETFSLNLQWRCDALVRGSSHQIWWP